MVAPALETKTLEFSTTIDGSIEHIWSMLSNRDDLCDWLCYDAHVRFNDEDGFATFIWYEGPHVYAVYKEIVEHEKIVMTWQDGTNQITKVKFKLEEVDGKYRLTVLHKGFTDDERAKHYEDLWDFRLNELRGIVENGTRPYIVDRVIIGVMADLTGDLSDGVPVTRVIDGYSAAGAGIQAGDVIVAVNGTKVNQETPIGDVTSTMKPGDKVEVTYRRDGEEKTVPATLKGHPNPVIHETFETMALERQAEYERVDNALAAALEGVTKANATYKAAEDDYSILEILAIMITRQRHTFEWLSTYAAGPRRINPYYTITERLQALIRVHQTAENLFEELQRIQAETVALIRSFSKDLEKRDDYKWWMVYEIWITEDEAMRRVQTIQERKEQALA